MATIPADAREFHREPGDAREQRLNEVIARYLEDLEAGRRPDRPGLMARHPDLAAELASFFANREHLEQLTAPLHDHRRVGDPPAVLPFPADAPQALVGPETRARIRRRAGRGRWPGRLLRRLRARRGDRRGRHGSRLQGPAGQPRPRAGTQDGASGPVRDARRPAAVPPGGRGRGAPRSPEHRADLRGRRARRAPLLQHEARRGREPGGPHAPIRRRTRVPPRPWWRPSPGRSIMLISGASCIATSSRRTSCWPRGRASRRSAGSPWSPTSGWPSGSMGHTRRD